MSRARIAFLERLSAYEDAVEQELIVTRTPTDVIHNARARLLRNGLAVVAFALLEDFIKTRIGEVLERVGMGASRFSDLPHALRVAATSGAIKAIGYQDRFLDNRSSSYFEHFQTQALLVASTLNPEFQVSPLAFGHDQPNLRSSTVEKMLAAFHIDSPWNAIESVARRAGVGVPALKAAFDSALQRRHEAAHRADANVEPSDLAAFSTETMGIALGVDLALSFALRKILDGDRRFLSGERIGGNRIGLRLIKFDGARWWRELVPGRSRAIARKLTLEDVKVECFRRASSNQEGVVIQDSRALPGAWYTPFID